MKLFSCVYKLLYKGVVKPDDNDYYSINNSTVYNSYTNKNNNSNNELNLLQLYIKKLLDSEKMPLFSFRGKKCYGILGHVYDGHTFSVIFLHNNEYVKYICRCLGYTTVKPFFGNLYGDKDYNIGQLAMNRFIELLRKNVYVRLEMFDFDEFGRIQVNVWNDMDEKSINDIMIEEGHMKK